VIAGESKFLETLTEPERIHFRHLALVRPQLPSEGQVQMLEGLARSLPSPRLLTIMARTPHWLAHWPILLGLAENEATPEAIRRDLEMVVSLFDQMREMDQAPPRERAERSDSVKVLYSQLNQGLKPVAKLLAKQLAKAVTATGTTQELPPLPGEQPDWEALATPPEAPPEQPASAGLDRPARLARAGQTAQPEELLTFLVDPDPDLRQAALQNPLISEDLVCRALAQCGEAAFFEEVYGEARWYFREPVRETLQDSPGCPADLSKRVGLSKRLVAALERGAPDRPSLRRIVSLFSQLEESEYQFITYWAKRQSPHLLRVVKCFYDRLQRQQASLASTLPGREEGRWATLEERVFLATQATQEEQLSQVLRDPNLQVFLLTLENPALTPRLLASTVSTLDHERAEAVAAHGSWCEDPMVAEALVHQPLLSEETALRLLTRLPGVKPAIEILRDARLPHLEVKRRALENLRTHYLGMSTPDRITALRTSGGELMRHLPQEVLQDEETLRRMVLDRQLDPGILLRLARNKLTPRSVLEQIAGHPVLMAHAAIMSELLLNPKTPRDASVRIWGLLSEAEQQQLLRSPHLPASLRTLD
jgi:transcriptional regulator with XRE-family HTH domain